MNWTNYISPILELDIQFINWIVIRIRLLDSSMNPILHIAYVMRLGNDSEIKGFHYVYSIIDILDV